MQQTRNIIVTGSSRGIGRAIAAKLAEKGDRVLINYLHNQAAAEESADQVRAKGSEVILFQGDVRQEADLKRMAKIFERVDILVHNAAIGALKPYNKLRRNHWDLTLESSLRPFWLLLRCRFGSFSYHL